MSKRKQIKNKLIIKNKINKKQKNKMNQRIKNKSNKKQKNKKNKRKNCTNQKIKINKNSFLKIQSHLSKLNFFKNKSEGTAGKNLTETKITKKVKTTIEGLDYMLNGGLPQGRNILLAGSCGTGKTTLAMQFACEGAIQHNEKSLYVTLEESKEKIIQDMEKLGFRIKHAQKKGKLWVFGGPIAKVHQAMEDVNADMNHIIEEIQEIIKEKKIKRVVIDSLNLLTLFQSSEDEKRKLIAKLCNALSHLNCTSMLISETKEGSMDISRYGMEEFVVDGVIALYLVRQGSTFTSGLVIRKMRGEEHDKSIRLYKIAKKGIQVFPNETMFGTLNSEEL